jgi:hypothetical protein
MIFQELGLDILRLKNNYRNQIPFEPDTEEIVRTGKAALGDALTLFLSSSVFSQTMIILSQFFVQHNIDTIQQNTVRPRHHLRIVK